MKAYKFRSNEKINRSLDIVRHSRLYCAPWTEMNDPMEGAFIYHYQTGDIWTEVSRQLEAIRIAKNPMRACALSKTFDSHMLWAHYANGFKGLAIEIELPDTTLSIHDVRYGNVYGELGRLDNASPDAVATELLTRKFRDWEYEREVRILQTDTYYQLENSIQRVIVGFRMPEGQLRLVYKACRRRLIAVYRIGIGDDGLAADEVISL